MDKIKKKRICAIIIIAIALAVDLFTLIKGGGIVGKWEIDPAEGNEDPVFYEFFKDNTGVSYKTFDDGDMYDEESFSYKLKDNKLMLDDHGYSKIYPCKISKDKMLLDDELYNRKEGGTSSTAIYCISAVLIILAIRLAL